MSKKLQFTVTIEFSDKITDDKEIIEVADNIARAITVETNGLGISPQDADAYTVSVSVKPQFLETVVTSQVIS